MIFSQLRLLIDGPASGAWNMAVDEALLRCCSLPTLRVYGWEEATVTFGTFERLEEIKKWRPHLPLIRRWTGGGLVEHGTDWTYSLIIPSGEAWLKLPRAESYRAIHGELREALEQGGIAGLELAGEDSGGAGGCFVRPVPGDLLWHGQKIAGAAQRRTRQGLLHQGSVQSMPPGSLQPETVAALLSREIILTPLTDAEREEAIFLQTTRYASPAWLGRF